MFCILNKNTCLGIYMYCLYIYWAILAELCTISNQLMSPLKTPASDHLPPDWLLLCVDDLFKALEVQGL